MMMVMSLWSPSTLKVIMIYQLKVGSHFIIHTQSIQH
jgi:hypothetical protein